MLNADSTTSIITVSNVCFWTKEDASLQLSARLRQLADLLVLDSWESRRDGSGGRSCRLSDRPYKTAGALWLWRGLSETGLAANRFWRFLGRCPVALLRPNRVAICRTTGSNRPSGTQYKAKRPAVAGRFALYGAPDRIRTCDPRLRRAVLYPTELRVLRGKTNKF